MLVSRSTDGGLTWGNPVVVNTDGHFNDKNWTVCDNTASSPFFGNCYTEFDDNTLGDLIQMSTSSDGGLTWGRDCRPRTTHMASVGSRSSSPTARSSSRSTASPGATSSSIGLHVDNGGASWGKTNIVARVGFRLPAGGLRATIPLPSRGDGRRGQGVRRLVRLPLRADLQRQRPVLSTSTDGKKWSKITRLPLDPMGSGVDHFIPGLAVDRVHLGKLARTSSSPTTTTRSSNCTAATCQLNVGYATSGDGGATWTANTHLAGPMSLTWLPNTTQGFMVGDYISTSFSGAPAYPAFALANAPSGGLLDEGTYTVRGGLSVAGAIAARDQTSAGSGDTLTSSSITAQ